MFVGAVFDKERCEYCLVTEFCEHGDLASYLADSEKPMNWKLRFIMCMDIARAMMYLHHKAGIIQRDLKSENLLIHEDFHVKLGDFGLSRTLRPGQMETFCGTPTHVAPEIVRQEDYTDKADVFSFGIILWELVTRMVPYKNLNIGGLACAYKVANEGMRPGIPTYCPQEIAELMEACWGNDADGRPSFPEILEVLKNLLEHLRKAVAERERSAQMSSKEVEAQREKMGKSDSANRV